MVARSRKTFNAQEHGRRQIDIQSREPPNTRRAETLKIEVIP